MLAVLLVVCLLLAAVVGYAWWRAQRVTGPSTAGAVISSVAARDSGLRAAGPLTERVLSYGWQTFADDVAATRSVLAPGFRSEYLDTMAEVRAETVANEVTLEADAVATSVVSASDSRVVALVFVDQVTTAKGATKERVDASRVMVTVTRGGGDWRIAELELF